MGLLGRTTLAASAAVLLLASPPVTAPAPNRVPQMQGGAIPISRTELIRADEETAYTVQPGDSLWAIAERQLGDAYRYPELADLNSGAISNPDLIYPAMVLRLPEERIWLVNNERQMPMGDYSFAVPLGMSVSCLRSSPAKYAPDGGASANFTLTYTDGLNFIACLVQDRDEALAESISDWDACCRAIRRYAAAAYRDTVSGLAFERYRTLTGEDVCLFSCVYRLDLAQYGQSAVIPIDVCMGIHLTDHMQAQFLGVGMDTDMETAGAHHRRQLHGTCRAGRASYRNRQYGHPARLFLGDRRHIQSFPVGGAVLRRDEQRSLRHSRRTKPAGQIPDGKAVSAQS